MAHPQSRIGIPGDRYTMDSLRREIVPGLDLACDCRSNSTRHHQTQQEGLNV